MVDELGRLDDQITIWQPTIARASELRKILQGYYANDPADEMFSLEGNRYTAIFSAKGRKHIVDKKALYKLLGPKVFVENCDFALKNLEVLRIDTTGIVTEERTGPRTVKAALRESAGATNAGRDPQKSTRRSTLNNPAVPAA